MGHVGRRGPVGIVERHGKRRARRNPRACAGAPLSATRSGTIIAPPIRALAVADDGRRITEALIGGLKELLAAA